MSTKNDDGEPIGAREAKLRDLTARVAALIDGTTGGMGFVLFLYDQGPDGHLSYASNGNREDVRGLLAEHLRKTETYAERIARTKGTP